MRAATISDAALERLRRVADLPDLSGTRYEAIELLGRGGMGSVYLARDRELDREVAIKVLRDPEPDEAAAARLLAEARTVARLEHPGIVPVHDAGRLADGRVFYAMKRVTGTRLDEHARGLPLDERLRLFERLCEPVAFAHAHGVVHRDLKPENVLVGSFGEVLVVDWGLARAIGPGAASERFAGTRGYAAPEQANGGAVDARADVHALGGVLHFLLTGQAPEAGAGAIVSARRIDASIPRRLDSIGAKAMARDPAARYPDVGALAADVRRFLSGAAVLAHRESPLERVTRVLHRYRTPILLVGAYLLMRALLLAFSQR